MLANEWLVVHGRVGTAIYDVHNMLELTFQGPCKLLVPVLVLTL